MMIRVALAIGLIAAATSAAPIGLYRVVHGWPVLATNQVLDEVSAVAVDSHDRVFVLTRGGRQWPVNGPVDTTAIAGPTVYVYDGRSGRLLSTWPSSMFALPHSITVDARDDVWVTDVAWHQVFKFNSEGKPLLTLGERGVPGEDAAHFNQPSDVAVATGGAVYVSDGYGNNRVVKFDGAGRFLTAWGKKGAGQAEFNLPHALALDTRGDVYVVDRENSRIQVFDSAGNYLTQWSAGFASPQDIKVSGNGQVFVASAGHPGPLDSTGVVIFDAQRRVREKVGRVGHYDGQFWDLHWLALSKSGDLYTADFSGRRIQKFAR